MEAVAINRLTDNKPNNPCPLKNGVREGLVSGSDRFITRVSRGGNGSGYDENLGEICISCPIPSLWRSMNYSWSHQDEGISTAFNCYYIGGVCDIDITRIPQIFQDTTIPEDDYTICP